MRQKRRAIEFDGANYADCHVHFKAATLEAHHPDLFDATYSSCLIAGTLAFVFSHVAIRFIGKRHARQRRSSIKNVTDSSSTLVTNL
jgi:hypothetical protein